MFGMRPGLDRIRLLLSRLGNPQLEFRPIHIVGTNGKSSTARFAAHLLAERGLAAGAYISPHLIGFEERVLLPAANGVREATADEFADAVGTVMGAVDGVEPELPNDDRITQFEIVTAAAFELFRRNGVEAAAIEAGMGGRFDATNVLGTGVVALTSVGLDHTQWLGGDRSAIAAEKLAVVKPGDLLVLAAEAGQGLDAELAEAASRSGRPLMTAGAVPGDGIELAAAGSFQLRNIALAEKAVDALLGESDPAAVARVAAKVRIPGRLMKVASTPDTWVDAAHNPDGIAQLAGELGSIALGRDIVCVFGVLADKDHKSMCSELVDKIKVVIATEPENPRSLSAARLAESLRLAGHSEVLTEPDPRQALAKAREIAGRDGVVLATGSVHLVGDLLSEPGQRTVTAL